MIVKEKKLREEMDAVLSRFGEMQVNLVSSTGRRFLLDELLDVVERYLRTNGFRSHES